MIPTGGAVRRVILILLVAILPAAAIAAVPNPRRQTPPSGIEGRAVAPGAVAPSFVLESSQGGTWDLSKALQEGPVVLVFYRGSW
ncbi:MAG: hypothetical protein HY049_02105 [Acidobacteria bacterium]|nr:hypothetical protein [Acidobacteriota bacterium]